LVADGQSNMTIAQGLDLSESTVKYSLLTIGRKLSASDRAHIVALSLRAHAIT